MFYVSSFRLSTLAISYPGPNETITDSTPLIEGVAPPGTTLKVLIDRRDFGRDRLIGETTADATGAWSIQVTDALTTDAHRVYAVAMDGNLERSLATENEFRVGPVAVPSPDSSIANSALSISWAGTVVTMWAGHFAHVDLSAVDSDCVSFASALQAALVDAGFASALVTYSTATHQYTLVNGGAPFAISFAIGGAGTRMARTLGFTSGGTNTAHTSTVRPYYVIVPALDARSGYSGLAAGDVSTRAESSDGRGFVIGPSRRRARASWEHLHEPRSAVFAYDASSDAPWTWQHLWEHAGPRSSLIYIEPEAGDPEPAGVWQLRNPDWTPDTHQRQYQDADMAWRIRVEATRLGDA